MVWTSQKCSGRSSALGSSSLASWTAWVAEGEWDGLALQDLLERAHSEDVVVAVPGAGVFKKSWVNLFDGRNVILSYDNDNAGVKGRDKAIGLLSGVAGSLRTICWPPISSPVFRLSTPAAIPASPMTAEQAKPRMRPMMTHCHAALPERRPLNDP